MSRTIVIGSGLAGLSAAIRLAEQGVPTTLVTFGNGGLQLSQGTIDILGYAPERVDDPIAAIDSLPEKHPYRILGAQAVEESTKWIANIFGPELIEGDPHSNYLVPTAIGALRPSAYVMPSMAAGDARKVRSYAVVGIKQIKDFQTSMVAGNIARTETPDGGKYVTSETLMSLEPRPGEKDPTSYTYARAMKDPQLVSAFAAELKRVAGEGDVVLVPPVLSYAGVAKQVSELVGRPVAESIMQPPAAPGRLMQEHLVAYAKSHGVRYMLDAKVTGLNAEGGRVKSVNVELAGHERVIEADAVIYAPGGFESGALNMDSHRNITETVFGLPLSEHNGEGLITHKQDEPQPLFEVGVRVDETMRVLDESGKAVYDNFYAAGGLLAGAQRWDEKSGDGIAVASGKRAAEQVGESK